MWLVAFDTLTLVYVYTCDHVSSKHPTHPPSPWKRHNPWCPSFPHPEGTGTWGQGWVWVPVRRCLDRNTCSLLDCVYGRGSPLSCTYPEVSRGSAPPPAGSQFPVLSPWQQLPGVPMVAKIWVWEATRSCCQ